MGEEAWVEAVRELSLNFSRRLRLPAMEGEVESAWAPWMGEGRGAGCAKAAGRAWGCEAVI